MEKQTTSNWYMVLIKGIVMILLALLILSSPGGALMTVAIYLGIGFLITGIVIVMRGFALRKTNDNWGWAVFEGALDIILGYIILINPLVTAELLPFIIGFWATFYGIMLVINAFSKKDNRMMKILSGIIIVLLGSLIMHNPLFIGLSIAIWAGVLLMIVGIYNVIASFSLK